MIKFSVSFPNEITREIVADTCVMEGESNCFVFRRGGECIAFIPRERVGVIEQEWVEITKAAQGRAPDAEEYEAVIEEKDRLIGKLADALARIAVSRMAQGNQSSATAVDPRSTRSG